MNINDLNEDKFVKNLVNKAGTEKPSPDFTNNLMNTIRQESYIYKYAYTPLISRKVIYSAVTAILLVFIGTLFFSVNNIEPDKGSFLYDNIQSVLSREVSTIIKIFSFVDTLLYALIAAFLLLLIDYIIKSTKYSSK